MELVREAYSSIEPRESETNYEMNKRIMDRSIYLDMQLRRVKSMLELRYEYGQTDVVSIPCCEKR